MPETDRKRLERRLKVIEYMVQGISPSEAVRTLSREFNVSERTLWTDWMNRKQWLPHILKLQDQQGALQDLFMQWQEARKMLFNLAMTGDNSSARVGALKEVISQITKEIEVRQSLGMFPQRPVEVQVAQETHDIKALLVLIAEKKPELLDEIIQLSKTSEEDAEP